ncbi:glycosyltransferase [Ligilactobacillus agilis]|uniref:glycosyltransferase n=1 Tax=Ligilactobacillus agilis TaxID=1601 RepID=UPI00255CC161|nr:glycosyltransferase [Ligilactobacillus agilis]
MPVFKWKEDYQYSNVQSFVQAIKQSDYYEEIPDRIQLTIGVDDGLILHLEALVHSLDKNTDTPIDLYIIYASLTAESISRVKFINDKLEAVTLILRPIPKESRQFIENINMDKARLPIGTYFRIIVPEVLIDLERVIYLDTDMVVNASLKPL